MTDEATLYAVLMQRTRYIIELKENWDGDGAGTYSPQVRERACRFVAHAVATWNQQHAAQVTTPKLHQGPDGSIDVLWKSSAYQVLLNVPPTGDIDYYGDTPDGSTIKGTVTSTDPAHMLMEWLSTSPV